jgi:DNA-binding SARP family transcriptional activator
VRFKNTLYRLRQALGQEIVLFENEQYLFNRSLDYEYDVQAFRDLIEQAQREQDQKKQIETYQQAAALYRGSFLSDIYGTWVLLDREKLWQAYFQVKFILVNQCLQDQEYLAVLQHCQDLLREDPCIEEAHQKIMIAYQRLGNRSAIIRQYERCQQALLTEHDLPPSQQTIDLYQRLIS